MRDRYESIGRRVWQRPKHDRVEDGEDRGRCADAKRQCDKGNEREGGRAHERAQALPPFAANRVDEIHTASLVMGDAIDVFRLSSIGRVVTEPSARLGAGRLARPSESDQFVDAAFQMESQLIVDLARQTLVRSRQPKNTTKTFPTRVRRNHRAGSGARTRDTASV